MAETPTGLFPDFKMGWDLAPADVWTTAIETALSGREQRRSVAPDRRHWTGSIEPLTIANRKTMRDFLNTKKGRYSAFYYWSPEVEQLAAFPVGSVSGATTITVPVKGAWWTGDTPIAAAYTTVYVGGVSKPFTPAANIGSNGEDRITFTGGAQTGAVTVDATVARLLIVARSDSDTVRRLFPPSASSLAQFQIAIQELI